MATEKLGIINLPFREFDLSSDFDLQCLFDRLDITGLSMNRAVAKELAKHITRMAKELNKQDTDKKPSTKEKEQ